MFVSDLRIEAARLTAHSDPIEQRAIAAYLGLAVGDALGATVEFMTPSEIRAQYREHRDIRGGGWLNLRRGRVTDDTEMALALGRSILETGAVDARAAADAFSEWMRSKPVDIGNTVRRGIVAYRRTGSTESPVREFDAGNGACMRCLPVALVTLGAEVSAVDAANQRQAHVTHNNPTSDAGTLCVIQMVQTGLLGGNRQDLKRLATALVAANPIFAYDRKRVENPGGFIGDTLRAVFQSLFATEDLESALIDVVNRGGDADTTGAILGMITGAFYGADALPARWTRHLEPTTHHDCVSQARNLLKRSPAYRARAVS